MYRTSSGEVLYVVQNLYSESDPSSRNAEGRKGGWSGLPNSEEAEPVLSAVFFGFLAFKTFAAAPFAAAFMAFIAVFIAFLVNDFLAFINFLAFIAFFLNDFFIDSRNMRGMR